MAKQPLAEVFGYPISNHSAEAKRCRDNALCPFGNKVPNCTKDKANNPLGVLQHPRRYRRSHYLPGTVP